MSISRGVGTLLEEVEDQLRHLGPTKQPPREVPTAEFLELKRTHSMDSEPSTSEHDSCATKEIFCKVHHDPEAQL